MFYRLKRLWEEGIPPCSLELPLFSSRASTQVSNGAVSNYYKSSFKEVSPLNFLPLEYRYNLNKLKKIKEVPSEYSTNNFFTATNQSQFRFGPLYFLCFSSFRLSQKLWKTFQLKHSFFKAEIYQLRAHSNSWKKFNPFKCGCSITLAHFFLKIYLSTYYM